MTQRETLLRLCAGNESAVALIEGVWSMCTLYDDCIDRDKMMGAEGVHEAMGWALFGINENPVYRAHPELRHALMQMIANWRAANLMERSGRVEALHAAYVLRCSPYGFFASVVQCVAGMEASIDAIQHFYGADTDDRFEAYLKEHAKESPDGMEKQA